MMKSLPIISFVHTFFINHRRNATAPGVPEIAAVCSTAAWRGWREVPAFCRCERNMDRGVEVERVR